MRRTSLCKRWKEATSQGCCRVHFISRSLFSCGLSGFSLLLLELDPTLDPGLTMERGGIEEHMQLLDRFWNGRKKRNIAIWSGNCTCHGQAGAQFWVYFILEMANKRTHSQFAASLNWERNKPFEPNHASLFLFIYIPCKSRQTVNSRSRSSCTWGINWLAWACYTWYAFNVKSDSWIFRCKVEKKSRSYAETNWGEPMDLGHDSDCIGIGQDPVRQEQHRGHLCLPTQGSFSGNMIAASRWRCHCWAAIVGPHTTGKVQKSKKNLFWSQMFPSHLKVSTRWPYSRTRKTLRG